MTRLVTFTLGILGLVFLSYASAQRLGNGPQTFEGYWMGVDHVDGGDARRSLVQASDGTFSLAARDSALTVCDGTDRGFASFSDGLVVDRGVMESKTLTIQCFNNSQSVVLHVRYELNAPGRMTEITTTPEGALLSTIVLHKVSLD